MHKGIDNVYPHRPQAYPQRSDNPVARLAQRRGKLWKRSHRTTRPEALLDGPPARPARRRSAGERPEPAHQRAASRPRQMTKV